MKISFTSKKTLAAVAMVIPLTLTACGSKESEESTEAMASSSTTTTTSSKSSEKDKPEEEKDKPEGEEDKPEGEEREEPENPEANPDEQAAPQGRAAAQGAGGPAAGENPLEGGQLPTAQVEPLQTGQSGTAEDAAQIKANLSEIYNQTTVQGMTNALVNNTCARVLEENGGAQVFDLGGQDVSLAELGVDTSQNYVRDVRDVKIDGNRASATVEVQTQQGTDTATQIFQNEGGRWKMCN